MTAQEHFPLGTPFRPSPAFVPWFIIDFVLIGLLIVLCLVLPAMLSGSSVFFTGAVTIGIFIPAILVFATWTRLYYQSMSYELHDDEMRWRRGVWFRTTGIVPYNRITNLDIRQGPVMRRLGISSISIQTAGYSGQAVPEIRIEAIEHAEELREMIRAMVRRCSSHGDGTGQAEPGARPDTQPATGSMASNILMLDELRKIRLLLEEQKK
jgi:membrane protein YdbS with pleckstrin-like domain